MFSKYFCFIFLKSKRKKKKSKINKGLILHRVYVFYENLPHNLFMQIVRSLADKT